MPSGTEQIDKFANQQMGESGNREDVWVIIPTYNEADNIGALVKEVRAYGYLVLVVDDSPLPDTHQAAAKAGAYVVWRQERKGLATAIVHGIKVVAKSAANYAVVMDAGGTHRAQDVRTLEMVAARLGFDVVIGSRFMGGYRVWGWRTWLSRAGTLATRLLGVTVTDATCGFRCYRINNRLLEALELCQAKGHAFQFELLAHLERMGARIGEVGIPYKLAGRSSLRWKTVLEAVKTWGKLSLG